MTPNFLEVKTNLWKPPDDKLKSKSTKVHIQTEGDKTISTEPHRGRSINKRGGDEEVEV